MKDKNPWPAGLMLTLGAFVVVQLAVVTLATTSFEGLDDVEYYRHGVEYGQEIKRRKLQQELGWKLDPKVGDGKLYLAIVDADGKPVMKAQVGATVGRPATVREDTTLRLQEIGPGIYVAPLSLPRGEWRIRLQVSKGPNLLKAEFRKRGDQ